ncbi:MAG: GNAT family N-acetyltransferase [Thermoanaerobaculia bacterium]
MLRAAIETERLALRPAATEDVDGLYRLWTHPEVRRFLWDDLAIARERAAAVVEDSLASFEKEGLGLFVAALRPDPRLVGFCGLRRFGEDREVEILYGIEPGLWGRGLATEAARAVLRHGFENLALDRIFAGADAPNAASFRVMEKLGMSFSKRLEIGGREVVYWAVSREEFRPTDAFDQRRLSGA